MCVEIVELIREECVEPNDNEAKNKINLKLYTKVVCTVKTFFLNYTRGLHQRSCLMSLNSNYF